MLSRYLDFITRSLLDQIYHHNLIKVPVIALANGTSKSLSLTDIFDGFMLATPKHRTPLRRIKSRKYGCDNWKNGTKLWKPVRNITTCLECGDFHEFHTICRTCFKKVEEESKKVIESIRNTWGMGVIDKEVQVLYQGEKDPQAASETRRIVELERSRPLWFAPNLSQKSTQSDRNVAGESLKELGDREVKYKTDD